MWIYAFYVYINVPCLRVSMQVALLSGVLQAIDELLHYTMCALADVTSPVMQRTW